jgi:hypothetical protein
MDDVWPPQASHQHLRAFTESGLLSGVRRTHVARFSSHQLVIEICRDSSCPESHRLGPPGSLMILWWRLFLEPSEVAGAPRSTGLARIHFEKTHHGILEIPGRPGASDSISRHGHGSFAGRSRRTYSATGTKYIGRKTGALFWLM